MVMQRRQFMRLGLAGSAVLPSIVAGSAPAPESLLWLRQTDDWAAPLLRTGDWLAVDVGVTQHDGDGIYLFPAWGQPRPYLVRAVPQSAGQAVVYEFCNPSTGQLLWTDSSRQAFAGRLSGRVPAQLETWLGHMPQLPLLDLPRLPA